MNKIKKQSIRELLGIKTFTNYGLETNKGSFVYFYVAPTNISVLSKENVEKKIRHLFSVIQAVPNIEIICTDSSQCFDENLSYLKDLEMHEDNGKICYLISEDKNFLDDIQRETVNARSFYILIKFKKMKDEQIFSYINRYEKIISDQGFECRRMNKSDLKKMLGIYFCESSFAENLPDIDGAQYFETRGERENEN